MRRPGGILLGALLALAWPALAAPPSPLHAELLTYEGIEYTCHLQQGRVWYDFAGKKLGERALKPQEIQDIQAVLRQQRFSELPLEMLHPTIDSSDTLTVWQGKKSRSVRATNPYDGPLRGDFLRFQTIMKTIRRVAPIPSADILRLQKQANP